MVDIIKCIAPEKWVSTYEIVDVLAASGEEEQGGKKLGEDFDQSVDGNNNDNENDSRH